MEQNRSTYLQNIFVWIVLVTFTIPSYGGNGEEMSVKEKIDLPDNAVEKIHQTLEALWPNKAIRVESLSLSKEQLSKAGIKPDEINLYALYHQGRLLGYLYLTQAPSKFKQFDYMVVFDRSLVIKKMRVLIYREHYGGEITKKRWLEQFEGKKNGEKMDYNEDIQAISGATISARSITRDVKRVSRNMQKLQAYELIVPSN